MSCILADTVEAIIGANLCGLSVIYNVLEPIVLKWYVPYLDHIEPNRSAERSKSRLQEYLPARKKPLPVYEVIDIQGDVPNQHFKVGMYRSRVLLCNHGEGSSRRFAEQAVAADILETFGAKVLMTTHSDHVDADHESQSDSNDLISQFFSAQGTEIPSDFQKWFCGDCRSSKCR